MSDVTGVASILVWAGEPTGRSTCLCQKCGTREVEWTKTDAELYAFSDRFYRQHEKCKGRVA